MKAILVAAWVLALASISAAMAKGCIKGAIVGGVAGHMAGHGKVGTAGGCAIGHHEANKQNPNNSNAQAPALRSSPRLNRRHPQGNPDGWAAVICGMTDVIESAVAPSAIERAMEVFESFKERDHAGIVQARKALTEHIFGLIAAGETDEQRMVVSGLTYLKSLERQAEAPQR